MQLKNKRYRNRRSYGRSRRQNGKAPLILFLLIISFFFWALFQFISTLFSNIKHESASAELNILQGRVEFLLPESSDWSLAFSEQKFLTNDTIKTGPNSKASLTIMDRNLIYINQNSELKFMELEQKSSGKKKIKIQLLKGQIWIKSAADDFAQTSKAGSQFSIETDSSEIYIYDSIIDISKTENQTTVRGIKGQSQIQITQTPETNPLNLGVGQKIVLNNQTITEISANKDILEILDSNFIESEWHLKNLEIFYPQDATQIRRKIEIQTPKPVESTTAEVDIENSIPAPQILSPQDGAKIPANISMLKIEGTAPAEAAQIMVNDYPLSKYLPGDKKWHYFAAQKFNTLVPGENKYTIVAISRDGKKSAPQTISIFYEGLASTESGTANSKSITLNNVFDFVPPVVTKPGVFQEDPNITYETSASIVTLFGTVDPKTNAIEVNGFKLKKFVPGNTNFSYIANANYGNMKVGDNIFTIKAFGPDNKIAETNIKIHYKPIDLGVE